MNLDMIGPKNETKDSLISITKNCETPIRETHTKPEETLEFKITKLRETLSIKPTISMEGSWMIGLIGLEVYTSFFNITEKIYKFDLYTDTFDEFSFTKLEDEPGEILGLSDFTPKHIQHKK